MTPSRSDTDTTTRVAVIGCGHWGRNLVRSFHELGALAAISETEPERASELSRRLQVEGLSLDEVLADGRIDGVVIATPAETHAAMALRALEAGKHVFVEKPLTLDVEDAHRVRQAAENRKRIVMVGHLLQYHPAFLRMRELVDQGRLGRLRYLYSNRLNLGKFRCNENVFWSFAPHDISMILSLAGGMPESVSSIGHGYLHRDLADVTTTHLRFGNGVNAHIFVSWLHPYKEQKLVAIGDEGMAVFDDTRPWAGKLTLYPHKVAWRDGLPEPARADPLAIDVQPAEPLLLECRHFLDCLRSGQRPRTDAWEGIRVVSVLDGSRRSMEAGRPIATSVVGEDREAYFVHPTAIVDEGCRIGAGTRIWHFSHILKGSRLGRDCVIGQNVAIGPDVTIGDRCKIQNNVSLYSGVVLDDGVFCGPSCVFTNVNNPRAEIERKAEFRPTRVGRGATIGANATIVCGHDLGAYSFVAAGAVVTKDVPPHALVAGNPARRIGWVSRAGERLGSDLVCPRTGARYRFDGRGGLVDAEEAALTAPCAAPEARTPA